MRTQLSPRDWEAISAYLDGQLSPKERARLEERLKARSDMQAALEEMRRMRAILRSQPKLRAPRNFTLTPEMVGQRRRERPSSRIYPLFGLASALATVLFMAVLLVDLISAGSPGSPAMVALQNTQEVALEAPAATEAPADAALSQRELPAQATPEAAEEMMEALEARDPTVEAERLTEAADLAATPPLTGEAYAPPESAYPAAGAEPDGSPYPSPKALSTLPDPPRQMMEGAPDLPEATSVSQARAAEQDQPGFWTPLRAAELALALIAAATGLVWLYLRRTASP